MQAANRVIYNTFLLYGKTAITLVISLYTTRIILEALGTEDFGLFNVIAGLVAMFSFLNATMATATQRFISFSKGTNDLKKLKKIFANSVILHLGISLIVVLVLEIAGLYFLNNQLKIPKHKTFEANMLFHLVLVTAFITINSVPYDAVLNANENIFVLVITNIIESILKLLAAFYIAFINNDKLFVYGISLLMINFAILLVKRIYVNNRYEEAIVVYTQEYDKSTIKELTSFASWNLFGIFSYLGRTQGLAILFNIFFGVLINSAYAISNQVATQINFFSVMMLQALNPQIMKNEGADNREKMLKLAFVASKFGFLLLSIISLPIIFEMKQILSLWLVDVPYNTSEICIFSLIALMINQITIGIDSAIHASGNIRKYMFVVGSLKLGVLPVAYILLKFNFSLNFVFYAYIIFETLGSISRLFILKLQMGVPIRRYLYKVVIKVIPVILIVAIVDFFIISLFDFKFRFVITTLVSITVFCFTSYYFALSDEEKKITKKLVIQVKSKFIGYLKL
jgi:Na+-driven multidrug efflux pump